MAAEQKIARAINAYRDRREGRPHPITAFAGAVRTVPQLLELGAKMRQKRKRHGEYVFAIQAHMIQWRQQRESALASLSPKMRAEVIAAEERAEFQRAKASAKLFSEDRARVYSEIHAANASAHVLAHLFSDSLALLDTSTLGSDRRRAYAADIAADPYAISGAIEMALAEGNRDLLAAAIAKARALDKNDRDLLRWQPREAADHLLADDMRHARAALQILALTAEEVRQEAVRLDGGTIQNHDKLTLGMMRKELELLEPEFLEDGNPQPDAA